ncbi:MAG TPA: efflux transporter outer membrane subunit [Steroidobacteraceae bacterium]|nr:efflux transporter outer membrane subunit [Steroidobacteraceae bacterium]
MSRALPPSHTAFAVGLLALLTGCAVGPNYREPKAPVGEGFAGHELVTAVDTPVQRDWWRLFNDPLLDELVDTALKTNHSLEAANARLKEARASRREQFFDYLPRLGATAGYTNVRQSAGSVPPGTPFIRDYELYDAGFDATWELDLFGRVRRLNQSARAAAEAAEASRNDVRLSVIAEIARNYFELRGAQNQLAVAQRNAENQTSALQLVNSRLDAGRGTLLDTSRAEAQVETTLARVPDLEKDVARAMHRIGVLTGNPPAALVARLSVPAPSPKLPESVALGAPNELLRRRPDIRVAERQLAAVSARIGVAVADLFPRITVNGDIGLQALRFDALDDHGNDRRSFGPSITWNFLDIGHISQQIKAAGARYEAQLADYQQTVLLALEDTENALSDFSRERRRLEHLDKAAKASVQAADLATQRFEGGVEDFLTALDAYRTALEAEDLLAESQTRAATALVALYKALGGGWEIESSDERSESSR